jgi:hypothetical protein
MGYTVHGGRLFLLIPHKSSLFSLIGELAPNLYELNWSFSKLGCLSDRLLKELMKKRVILLDNQFSMKKDR